MTRMRSSIFRWAAICFGLHSAILLLIAPSAFLYYGEGFILSGSQASHAHRLLDAPVHAVVYDVINYRVPHRVHWWL